MMGYFVISGLTASEDRFAVGDCLRFDDGKYKDEGCDEPQAKFEVYALKPDASDCIEVPGTQITYYESTPKGGSNWFCIGDKDTDVGKAINAIDVGECVVAGSTGAEKTSCKARGSRPVLKVLKDVSKLSVGSASGNAFNPNECVEAGARKTKLTYSWGLEDRGPRPLAELSWDRVLCLGK